MDININQIIKDLNSLHYQMEQNPTEYAQSTKLRETLLKFYHLERKTKKLRYKNANNKKELKRKEICGIQTLRYNRAVKLRKAYQVNSLAESNSQIPLNSISNNPIIIQNSNNHFKCYICKTPTNTSHSFYDQLCEPCGNFNYEKRFQSCDLNGKVSIVTGGRIKIGFETGLKLLRAGSTVIITTRFPTDALVRYSNEPDYDSWKNRLEIVELDLRNFSGIVEFCKNIHTKYNKIDILIQNAAQTIWRPLPFYRNLVNGEDEERKNGTSTVQNSHSVNPLQITATSSTNLQIIHPEDMLYNISRDLAQHHFPINLYDEHHQQLDLRPKNSWIQEIEEIQPIELIQTHLINYISPFILLQHLIPTLSTGANLTYVIMVSAMEGSFSRGFKTSQHVHTNCAKASLNMIVRTCSDYFYSKYQICMNAVDTGWVTHEEPTESEADYKSKPAPPLDEIDGASRILDPIFQSQNDTSENAFGSFLKDYKPISW